MKYISHNEIKKIKNGDACAITEYGLHNYHIDIVKAHIHGRYPESGCVQNRLSTEVCLVTSGSGRITINGETYALNTSDVILIEPDELFFWKGDMEIVISCSPPWSLDQYKHVV